MGKRWRSGSKRQGKKHTHFHHCIWSIFCVRMCWGWSMSYTTGPHYPVNTHNNTTSEFAVVCQQWFWILVDLAWEANSRPQPGNDYVCVWGGLAGMRKYISEQRADFNKEITETPWLENRDRIHTWIDMTSVFAYLFPRECVFISHESCENSRHQLNVQHLTELWLHIHAV